MDDIELFKAYGPLQKASVNGDVRVQAHSLFNPHSSEHGLLPIHIQLPYILFYLNSYHKKVEFSRKNDFWIRFIEYMDVGNSNNWVSERMVSKQEILQKISSQYPLEETGRNDLSAPAVNYRFLDGAGNLGVIASVTEPFCRGCTRARLTADGKLVMCLFADQSHDLKKLLVWRACLSGSALRRSGLPAGNRSCATDSRISSPNWQVSKGSEICPLPPMLLC